MLVLITKSSSSDYKAAPNPLTNNKAISNYVDLTARAPFRTQKSTLWRTRHSFKTHWPLEICIYTMYITPAITSKLNRIYIHDIERGHGVAQ